MNSQAQSKVASFPSWNTFPLQNNNRTLGDRNSKFLFHYDDETFDTDDEGEKKLHIDEYHQRVYLNDEWSEDKFITKSTPNRKRLKTKKPRKKRPRWKEKGSSKRYIGEPKRDKSKRKKKKSGGQSESKYKWPMAPVMHAMLDFLSKPGDYFSNLMSSYAGGQGDYSFGGGNGYKGGSGGGGYKGGGGSSGGGASNAAASGIIDGLTGIIGDTTLSRKVQCR